MLTDFISLLRKHFLHTFRLESRSLFEYKTSCSPWRDESRREIQESMMQLRNVGMELCTMALLIGSNTKIRLEQIILQLGLVAHSDLIWKFVEVFIIMYN